MKLWKCAAIVLTLCGAALSLFLTRIMVPTPPHHSPTWDSSSSSHTSSSSSVSSSNSSSSSLITSRQRRARSTEGISSILTELMHMFQSFTEDELKQVIGTLVERKARREARQSKRTKRAKKATKPCSLRKAEVTVSQLGLGYDSDETLLFRYCSGSCKASRRNYDVILKKWQNKGIARRERSPCCRPTAYDDDISFLDNNNKYKTLNEWSALDCGCV